MKSLLKKLFGNYTLIDIAKEASVEEFVDQLLRTRLYLLGLADEEGVSANCSKDDLLKHIEKNADINDDDFSPMTLDLDGRESVLVFTSGDTREKFVGIFSSEANRIFAFQTAALDGTVMLDLAKKCDFFVLNPGVDTLHLTEEHVIELKRRG